MYTCSFTYINLYMRVCDCVYTPFYMLIYVYAHTHTCKLLYVHVYMCICMYMSQKL